MFQVLHLVQYSVIVVTYQAEGNDTNPALYTPQDKTMQLLAVKFNQIATAIDATNAQITALQAKLSELQEHQQQLLSVEQACQSALAQVGTALSMLNHVDSAEIPTFKAAVDAQFGTDVIAFLESATPATAEEIEPEPTAPTAPEPAAPDV